MRIGTYALASVLAATLAVKSASAIQDGEASEARPGPHTLLVVGTAGSPEYGNQFDAWADRIENAARSTQASLERLDPTEDQAVRLESAIARAAVKTDEVLWIVWIGHGSFDGEDAKWNLEGPDVSARELSEWLAPLERPLALVLCSSSSGAFLPRLSAPGRVLVSATKSGEEYSFSRFGDGLSLALCGTAGDSADLDKDDQVSLLEAFLFASARAEEFYAREARLATEHALLDDNADSRGTPATWFRGVRCVEKAVAGQRPDGARAHQIHWRESAQERSLDPKLRAERDRLELAIETLRTERETLGDAAYFDALEALALELARLAPSKD